jgi:hypothetical protein
MGEFGEFGDEPAVGQLSVDVVLGGRFLALVDREVVGDHVVAGAVFATPGRELGDPRVVADGLCRCGGAGGRGARVQEVRAAELLGLPPAAVEFRVLPLRLAPGVEEARQARE